jgi:hypothetical protein
VSDSASSVIETILDKNGAMTLALSRPCQLILAYLTRLLQIVRRQRGKPSVLDWTTHREMVKALPIARRDSEHLVNRIIEVAANPGCTNSRIFRLEVQYLPHKTGFPEEIAVKAGTVGDKAVQVVCQHCKAERPVPRNILPA